MNDLELFLLRKDFLTKHPEGSAYTYTFGSNFRDYIYENNLQDELTLKEALYVADSNFSFLLFWLNGFVISIPGSERYISENPEVSDMKISNIVKLKIDKK